MMVCQEYQVIKGDVNARDITGWTVWAEDIKEAEVRARREQARDGGRGPISVRGPLVPECDLCGFRHREPPKHLERDSYCRA